MPYMLCTAIPEDLLPISDAPISPAPFSPAEYGRRLGKIATEMPARKPEALFVEAPSNTAWFTGCDGLPFYGHQDVVPFDTEAGVLHDPGMDCILCSPGSIDEFVSREQRSPRRTMQTGLEAHV